jgi:hypothetical protein
VRDEEEEQEKQERERLEMELKEQEDYSKYERQKRVELGNDWTIERKKFFIDSLTPSSMNKSKISRPRINIVAYLRHISITRSVDKPVSKLQPLAPMPPRLLTIPLTNLLLHMVNVLYQQIYYMQKKQDRITNPDNWEGEGINDEVVLFATRVLYNITLKGSKKVIEAGNEKSEDAEKNTYKELFECSGGVDVVHTMFWMLDLSARNLN